MAACVGAFVWLLLTAGSASADEPTIPAGDPGDPRPAAAELRSVPSPLGERASAAARDRSAPPKLSERPAPTGPESSTVSLSGTVEAVGDAAISGQREVGRTVDPVTDAVPAGDRVVEAVTEQVDRTIDSAVEAATTVARTVDVALTEPLVRPVLGQLPGGATDGPAPVPDEQAGAAPDRVGETDPAIDGARDPGHPGSAPAMDAPRHLAAPTSLPRLLPDPADHRVPDERLRTAVAPSVDDLPAAAVPGDGQPDLGDEAGSVASADGGGGALAVLDGRSPDRADGASAQSLPQRDAPRGPSHSPTFSPD